MYIRFFILGILTISAATLQAEAVTGYQAQVSQTEISRLAYITDSLKQEISIQKEHIDSMRSISVLNNKKEEKHSNMLIIILACSCTLILSFLQTLRMKKNLRLELKRLNETINPEPPFEGWP